MKKLPIGIDDFKELIEQNYYFVDKSLFIKNIIEEDSKVLFLPRPRRFGKSLNMSMLRRFLSNKKSEENNKLFDGLKISLEKEIMPLQGKYPVIYISFKDVKEKTFKNCLNKVMDTIQTLFKEHKYLLDNLDEFDSEDFRNIIRGKASQAKYENSLKFLSQLLSEYYNEKVFILIDEYDQPIIASYTNNYFDEGKLLFRNLYSAALKGNEHLNKGILTGILRIAKESIFSGLNNLSVDSILQNQINYFGLLENEVKEILDYYDMSYEIDEVREWYNGYKFGDALVYNPWSIINFVKSKELKSHWVNTSSNDLIKASLINISKDEYNELVDLCNNQEVKIDIEENIAFDHLENPSVIWNLMLFSGYLSLTNNKKIRFPNREIREFYINEFKTLAGYNINKFNNLLDYLIKADLVNFENLLRELFMRALSYYDTSTEEEKYYHNLMLGLAFGLEKKYIIHSNREYGTGRVDLLLKSKNETLPNYIFEFKVSNKESNLKELAQEALEQIDKKQYDFELNSPIKIGMAFYKKEFELIYKKS